MRADATCCRPASPPCLLGCVGCVEHLTRPCCVLLEVTQRCNLHCPVCYANAGEGVAGAGSDPSLTTIAGWFETLKEKAGICHIQLSGGEPTLRSDLSEIILMGKKQGFQYFQLNTNGIRLGDEPALAEELKEAGLSCVFLQFDCTDDTANIALRGAALAEKKLAAIEACAAAKLPVVLVPTVVRGINDGMLADIVRFAMSHSPTVRGVHFQPATTSGRWALCGFDGKTGTRPNPAEYSVTIPELLGMLERQSASMIAIEHFSFGGAEHRSCSFNANYSIASDGRLTRQGCRDGLSSGGSEPCCSAEGSSSVKPDSGNAGCCDQPAWEMPGSVKGGGSEQAAWQKAATHSVGSADSNTGGCCDQVSRAQDIQKRRWAPNLDALPSKLPAPGTLDEAYWRATARGFSITGMAFMDAETLDFERLRRCYLFIMSQQGELVPFCAFNLAREHFNSQLSGPAV